MWKRLQIRKQPSGSRLRANCPIRPWLEVLEDRVVPAVFTVNNPTDTIIPGQMNLRQAIQAVNGGTGGDTINIAVSGTDTLNSNMDAINKANTIISVTPGNFFAVSGNNMFRDFSVTSNGGVIVNGNNNLTFTGGRATDGNGGAGILNNGNLQLNGTTVTLNTVLIGVAGATNAVGGGIANTGTLTLNNDMVTNNTAQIGVVADTGRAVGGGIANLGGTVTGTNVVVSGNRAETDSTAAASFALGGGIDDEGTSFSLSASTVSGNTANSAGAGTGPANGTAVGGGGIATEGDNAFVLNRVGLNRNRVLYDSSGDALALQNSIAGAGLFIDSTSTASVTSCTISNNVDNCAPAAGGFGENGGGGIFNRGTLVLGGTTVSTNSVTNSTVPPAPEVVAFGGGILNVGTLRATNDTIWANSASATGAGATATSGGLRASGTNTLINCTVGMNTATATGAGAAPPAGGGIGVGGTLNLVNTIDFNPGGAADGPDVSGTITRTQNSLYGSDVSGQIAAGGNLLGNQFNATPLLGPLANNGGPTLTVAELAGSPTIDTGATASPLGAIPTTDQRGVARPDIPGTNPDMGAFEFVSTPTPTPTPTKINNLNVSESFGLFGGQTETVKGQVVNNGIPVSGGPVTITDSGESQTVSVDSNGNFTGTFTFNLFQEFSTAKAHTITASYGGATVGTTTFASSGQASVNSPDSTSNFLFQLLLDAFILQSLGI
jgi:hypothetical protein